MLPITRLFTLICLLSCIPPLATASSPPPEYVELTPERIKHFGFEYTIWKKGAFSFIDLRFPARLSNSLVPHSTRIVTKNSRGVVVQDSMNWTGQKYLSVVNRFNHEHLDLSVSVVFSCGVKAPSNCYGAQEFGITSVNSFVKKNARPDDLLPEQAL